MESEKRKYPRLYGFIQSIVCYIASAQYYDTSESKSPAPAKAHFSFMSRRSFQSMYKKLLTKKEKLLFKTIVKNNIIPRILILPANSEFFAHGYWGHFDPKRRSRRRWWALFKGGKIVKLKYKSPNSPIIDCSRQRSRYCGKSVRGTKITIGGWLRSIVGSSSSSRRRRRDLLSPPRHGSRSMGKIKKFKSKPYMAMFEVRSLGNIFKSQPYTKWVSFAEERFKRAAARRPGSKLTY